MNGAEHNVHLLGRGLDAIIQRDVEAMPATITGEMRLRRYFVASIVHPGRHFQLRLQIGTGFKDAWARGMTPQLAKIGRVMERLRKACEPC